jgi:hypothetical protein
MKQLGLAILLDVCRILCDGATVVCPTGTTGNRISGGNHKSCQP